MEMNGKGEKLNSDPFAKTKEAVSGSGQASEQVRDILEVARYCNPTTSHNGNTMKNMPTAEHFMRYYLNGVVGSDTPHLCHKDNVYPAYPGFESFVGSTLVDSPSKKKSKDGILKCTFCPQVFTSDMSLKLHQFTHTGVDTFPCSECGRVFLSENILKSHLATHSDQGSRPYMCKVCLKSFKKPHELAAHELIHAPEKPFSCEECGKTFAQKGNLKTHLMTHSGVKPYKCVFCEKAFTQRGNLQHHMFTHVDTNKKPFSCDVCGKTFAQKGNLKSHQETGHSNADTLILKSSGMEMNAKADKLYEFLLGHSKNEKSTEGLCGQTSVQVKDILRAAKDTDAALHKESVVVSAKSSEGTCQFSNNGVMLPPSYPGIESFVGSSGSDVSPTKIKILKCGVCPEVFTNEMSLKLHQFTHTGVETFACGICGRVFLRENILKTHLATHSDQGSRPYMCKVCLKSFRKPHELAAHELIHAPEKPFSCEECGKTFAQKGNLKTHLMTHSGVKPYKCVFCEKAFTQRGNLQHHMFLHTEKKPFSCEECGKSFAQKGNLKSHQASVHSSAEKLYTCSVCGHSFAFQGSLKNHQEKVHNSKLPKINNVMSLVATQDTSPAVIASYGGHQT